MGHTTAPKVESYGYQKQADTGAINAIRSLPSASAATGYDPASTVTAGNNLIASANQYSPYINTALMHGFDPNNAVQNDLYNRGMNQNLAAQARQGVAMTPYGAGVSNQFTNDFNNQWWLQQLQRESMGANTAASLGAAANAGTTAGAQIAQSGGNYAMMIPQMQAADYMQYQQGATARDAVQQQAFNNTNAASNAFWGGVGQLAGTGASMMRFI